MKMNYYEIGQRIRKFRKARSLSQEKLAEIIGISATHMSHIETGNTKLSLQVLVSLAQALEVRTDDIIYKKNALSRNSSIEGIIEIIDNSSTQEIKIIEDIIRATQISLKKHL